MPLLLVLLVALVGELLHIEQAPLIVHAEPATTTPLKHIIIILGENHTFDNIFGAYKPLKDQSIDNLLSKGIITSNGRLGPRAWLSRQHLAQNRKGYSLSPQQTGSYRTLPQPNTTYAKGLPRHIPDRRFPADLPNGPYQITRYVPYHNAIVGDPIHRFYQMWQQIDKGKNDLFTWVAQTAGRDNGAIPPLPVYQGAVSMGYYNMSTGDAPDFRFIADHYTISDNYHQSIMGGTGVNHIAIGTADMAFYTDSKGNPARPPAHQIENPNPKPGTNNNYTQDGYSGGSYSECANVRQPGVGPILDYLHSLPYKAFRAGDCAPGSYYLLNNYKPAYTATGQRTTGTPFVVPPQDMPTIANELSAHNISWKYYGQSLNNQHSSAHFCDICDPFQYVTSIMHSRLKDNIQDFTRFQADVANDRLPAVSFIKPDSANDGHAASSALNKFETFSTQIVNEVMHKPALFKQTAIIVTFDEGGGYYDSGYIQPLDFFGDGPRVPLMVISPYARRGYVDHTYYDHTSLLKFIERNWRLHPLSARSFDNLPDPLMSRSNPYQPLNRPAIGDLMQLFDFQHPRHDTPLLP
ncbi:phosphoesterase [Ktedonosporobacter rubrisoli]|uniref:Phosphoesterase n=1 Tax=Ktedonosporobacter rubrisoli TaxID=2509675 RepID=A0A4P6K2I3_KTERU|nr:alkaline phosphatase family protein [Ktedonosporobacter rubrisoli]QBD82225.1 phosphoesterase [Ktedonosporobacter rubrisoli]